MIDFDRIHRQNLRVLAEYEARMMEPPEYWEGYMEDEEEEPDQPILGDG